MKRQFLFLFLMFLFFFVLGNLFEFYTKKDNEQKKHQVCDNSFMGVVDTCKLVKTWIVLELQGGPILVFTVLAPNNKYLSSDFSKTVVKGDLFHKNNQSDTVGIEKKSGVKTKWRINCNY